MKPYVQAYTQTFEKWDVLITGSELRFSSFFLVGGVIICSALSMGPCPDYSNFGSYIPDNQISSLIYVY